MRYLTPLVIVRRHCFLILCLMISVFSSCSHEENPDPSLDKARKTVLVYMAAENSLSSYINDDLEEIIEGAAQIPNDCHLLIYIDDLSLPRIVELKQTGDTTSVYYFSNEIDSASKTGLQDVLNVVKSKFSSEGYGLVMWSHGESWMPANISQNSYSRRKTFGIDSNNNQAVNDGSMMDISDIADAITSSIGKADYIFFDVCLMQTIETAYDLMDATDYIIGSPAEIPGPGAPYHKMISSFFKEGSAVSDIAYQYYNYYNSNDIRGTLWRYGITISMIDCARLPELASQTGKIIGESLENAVNDSLLTHYAFGYNAIGDRYSVYVDMNNYIEQVADAATFSAWISAFNAAVPVVYSTNWLSTSNGFFDLDISDLSGVACYCPCLDNNKEFIYYYKNTSFYNDCVAK